MGAMAAVVAEGFIDRLAGPDNRKPGVIMFATGLRKGGVFSGAGPARTPKRIRPPTINDFWGGQMSNIFNGQGQLDDLWNQSDEEEYQRQRRREANRERGFLDRASDEMRAWFGDHDAERRRRLDEQRYGRRDRFHRGDYDPAGRRGYRGEYESQAWRDEYAAAPSYESGFERQPYGSQVYGRRYRDERGYAGQEYYEPDAEPYCELWMAPGPFTGVGPMGYQRPDERIWEDICERLARHGLIDASRIEVAVIQGEVTLRGSVSSRGAKRMAEETAESVSGVRQLQNQLRVGPEQSQTPGSNRIERSSEYDQQWQSDQRP
jgi:osmotically-inducible protein OsmY